jgi:hypothetical protein
MKAKLIKSINEGGKSSEPVEENKE